MANQEVKLISRGKKGINQYVIHTGIGKKRTSQTKHMTETEAKKYSSED